MPGIITLRVIVIEPPAGAHFAVQCGKDELIPAVSITPEEIRFEFEVRVSSGPDGRPNFLGACTHGPREGRFVYVNSGGQAGQAGPWSRRAKLSLMGIEWAQLDALQEQPGSVLEARIAGRAKDGGPACASVPIIGGWRVVGALAST